MKTLRDLLTGTEYELIKGSMDTEVKDVIYDSRKVEPGTVFVCMVGALVDGHIYIPDAIKKGACAMIIEHDVEIDEDVAVIKVPSARKALSHMSAAYFDYPAKKMTTANFAISEG